MTRTHRIPRTLDVVPLDTTRRCQLYKGEEPERCENTAGYVFVYEGQTKTREITTPRNALACESCVPSEL